MPISAVECVGSAPDGWRVAPADTLQESALAAAAAALLAAGGAGAHQHPVCGPRLPQTAVRLPRRAGRLHKW